MIFLPTVYMFTSRSCTWSRSHFYRFSSVKFSLYYILPVFILYRKLNKAPVTSHTWEGFKCLFLKWNGYDILSLIVTTICRLMGFDNAMWSSSPSLSFASLVFLIFYPCIWNAFLCFFQNTCCYGMKFLSFLDFCRFWKGSNKNYI